MLICNNYIFSIINIQSHPNAKGLRRKVFVHFEELAVIFGKDRTIREGVETPTDMTFDMNETE